MEVYLNICSDYKDKKVKNCVQLVNESIENHGLFQGGVPNAVDSHLKEISVLLQSVKTKNQGFELLLPVIQQGSQEVIEKRSVLWFGACSQSIISLCGASEKINACKIITILLKATYNLPELHKTLFTKLPSSLIKSLAAADASWNSAALTCLHEFIKFFPGQCLPQKVAIEEHMLKYLDNPLARAGQEDIVKKAGQVFAAIPMPGMGGNKAQGRAEARGRQVTQLIALAHTIMDALFEGIVEKESYKHVRQCTLKVSPLQLHGKSSSGEVRGFLAAVTRLGNTLKFLSEMLTSDVNESISLAPYYVLSPIFRLLQVMLSWDYVGAPEQLLVAALMEHTGHDKNDLIVVDSSILKSYRSQEHQLLSFLISSLHHHCLLLLRDLIMSIGECIDLYFGVIADLLLSVIKMSLTKDESAWCASGVQTRIISYSVMATVVQISGGRHTPSKELVTLMLQDIIPKGQQVTLQKTPRKGLSSLTVQKKKKKKGYSVKESDSASRSGPLFQSELLCHVTRAALSLAETLFAYASHSLPHKMKQILQCNIVNVTESVAGGAVVPEAYTNGKTRAQMYRTLASVATHPDPRCPPPYTMILYLLQHGHQDQQMLVVTTCQALIGNVSFILANPQIADMSLVLQQSQNSNEQDMEEESAENGPTITTPDHSEKEIMDDDDNDEEEDEEDDIEKEDNDMEKDKEKTEENVSSVHPIEVIPPKSSEIENGIDVICEVESDVEEVDTTKEEEKQNDSEDEEENEDDVEDIDIPVVVVKPSTETGRKKNKTDIASVKKLSKVAESPSKRKTQEKSPVSSKKKKRKNNATPSDGPTLEEMLGAFVDAPPDE